MNWVRSGNIGNVELLGSSEADGGVVTEPRVSADDIAGHLGLTKVTVSSRIAEKHVPAGKIGRGGADSGSNGAGD